MRFIKGKELKSRNHIESEISSVDVSWKSLGCFSDGDCGKGEERDSPIN